MILTQKLTKSKTIDIYGYDDLIEELGISEEIEEHRKLKADL